MKKLKFMIRLIEILADAAIILLGFLAWLTVYVQ